MGGAGGTTNVSGGAGGTKSGGDSRLGEDNVDDECTGRAMDCGDAAVGGSGDGGSGAMHGGGSGISVGGGGGAMEGGGGGGAIAGGGGISSSRYSLLKNFERRSPTELYIL